MDAGARVRHARRGIARALALLAALAAAGTARGGEGCVHAAAAGGEALAAVEAGATLVLASGQAARPAGILVPLAPEPLARAARQAAERLFAGRRVLLVPDGTADRHGRILADIFAAGEGGGPLWLQHELVRNGLARVDPFGDNRACIRALLAAEEAARRARQGLWRDPAFAVRAADRPDELNRFIDTFQIIEGRPVSIGTSRGRVYLNFGRRWRSDFTGFMSARDAARLAAAGRAPDRLDGRLLRLRGYLEADGGPMLRLTHPDQIEVIDADATR